MASKAIPSPQLIDDVVTFRKFASLAFNLGKPQSFADFGSSGLRGVAPPMDLAQYSLNIFGQVRGGYMFTNYSTPVRGL